MAKGNKTTEKTSPEEATSRKREKLITGQSEINEWAAGIGEIVIYVLAGRIITLELRYLRIGNRNLALQEYEILKTINPDMANALYAVYEKTR